MSQDRINPTTGLFTQPLFETLYEHEIARTRRYPTPLTLIRITACTDNESDENVKESLSMAIAQVLNTQLRETDIIGHYEEDYLVLLPNTSIEGGLIAARRVMDHLRGLITTRQNNSINLAVCIGISGIGGGPTSSADDLLRKTILALQEARRRGPGSLVSYAEVVLGMKRGERCP